MTGLYPHLSGYPTHNTLISNVPIGFASPTTPLFVVKSADQVVNNSATLVDDTELVVLLDTNTTYLLQAFIIHAATSTADYKFTFTVPTGSTIQWIGTDSPPGAGNFESAVNKGIRNSGDAGGSGTNGATTPGGLFPMGVINTGATSGDLQFQFAQNTAEASDATTFANSFLALTPFNG